MSKSKSRTGVAHLSSLPVIVELWKADDGQFYILYRSTNGKILSKSSEYYKRRAGALNSVKAMYSGLRKMSGVAVWDGDYRDYTAGDGKYDIEYDFM